MRLIQAETQLKIAVLKWFDTVVCAEPQNDDEVYLRNAVLDYKSAVDEATENQFKPKGRW